MRVLAFVVAALASHAALADLVSAQTAYQKGDYQEAAKEYRAMAELGNSIAQYDLAALYLNGQGVKESALNAYAWASLAADSGYAPAKALADKLRPKLAPGSEQIAREIVAPYDRAALDAAIMPKMEDDEFNKARCNVLSASQMEYPPEARDKGIQSSVFVEYAVAPDGRARNPRIIYAIPRGLFDPAVRALVLSIRHPEGPDVAHCRVMARFKSDGYYPELESLASRTRKAAEDGDPGSQYNYGLMLAGLPQMNKSHGDALPWFLKAAQGGSAAAQYQVGASLLYGIGCKCEVTKGEVWLRRAAEAGQPDAQVTLGTYALRGEPGTDEMKIARLWLERAVSQGDLEGMYYLSALLAAAPDSQVRDSARALRLLEQLKRDREGNPSIAEIRAAAQAASGDYGAAKASEDRAIAEAKRLHWDLTPLNERRARYEAGQSWFGNLLVL